MILEFERGLIQYCLKFDPRVKRVEFVDEFDTVYETQRQVEYPVVQITRNIKPDDTFPKSYDHEDEFTVVKFFVAKIQYTIRFWYERESYAIIQFQRIRFYCENNPYIYFKFDGALLHIGMRFYQIGLNTIKRGDDRKGAQRAVEVNFESSIPFSENQDFALIEEVQINIDGTVDIQKIVEDGSIETEHIMRKDLEIEVID